MIRLLCPVARCYLTASYPPPSPAVAVPFRVSSLSSGERVLPLPSPLGEELPLECETTADGILTPLFPAELN